MGASTFAAAVVALAESGGRVDDLAGDDALIAAVRRCAEKPKRGKPKYGFAPCDKCGEPVILSMNTARRKSGAKCRITPKCGGKHRAVDLSSVVVDDE